MILYRTPDNKVINLENVTFFEKRSSFSIEFYFNSRCYCPDDMNVSDYHVLVDYSDTERRDQVFEELVRKLGANIIIDDFANGGAVHVMEPLVSVDAERVVAVWKSIVESLSRPVLRNALSCREPVVDVSSKVVRYSLFSDSQYSWIKEKGIDGELEVSLRNTLGDGSFRLVFDVDDPNSKAA